APVLSAEHAVLSVLLMWVRTHSPASQPGSLHPPGIAVTGFPALSVEQAVLSGFAVMTSQRPVSRLHSIVLQSVLVQVGQRSIEADCELPELRGEGTGGVPIVLLQTTSLAG